MQRTRWAVFSYIRPPLVLKEEHSVAGSWTHFAKYVYRSAFQHTDCYRSLSPSGFTSRGLPFMLLPILALKSREQILLSLFHWEGSWVYSEMRGPQLIVLNLQGRGSEITFLITAKHKLLPSKRSINESWCLPSSALTWLTNHGSAVSIQTATCWSIFIYMRHLNICIYVVCTCLW